MKKGSFPIGCGPVQLIGSLTIVQLDSDFSTLVLPTLVAL